jgi:hypothetical protein
MILSGERRLQVLDVMTANNPGPACRGGGSRTAGRIRVRNRCGLHPVKIFDVVGVTVCVDGGVGNDNSVAMDGGLIAHEGEGGRRDRMETPAATRFGKV